MSTISNFKLNSMANNIALEKSNESRRIGEISSTHYPLKDEFEVAYFNAHRNFLDNQISTRIQKSPQDICDEYKKYLKNKNVNF